MNANRITRRQALAAGMGSLVLGPVAAVTLLRNEEKPWLGGIMMAKKDGLSGICTLPNGQGEGILTHQEASYTVKGEKGTRIEILDANLSCWIEKERLVLLDDAIDFFTAAIKSDDKDRFALNSRGWAYYLLGKPENAIADFDTFLKIPRIGTIGPARWEGFVNRGLVFAEKGEYEKALADLSEALKEAPGAAMARVNRGYTYELMGEYAKAEVEYTGTLHPLAVNNLAWLRATCPDEDFRDAALAVKDAQRMCDMTKDREGMFLDTLAAAYAEAGKFEEAVKAQEKALTDKSFALRYGEDARKRLRLYENKKPYRSEPVKKK